MAKCPVIKPIVVDSSNIIEPTSVTVSGVNGILKIEFQQSDLGLGKTYLLIVETPEATKGSTLYGTVLCVTLRSSYNAFGWFAGLLNADNSFVKNSEYGRSHTLNLKNGVLTVSIARDCNDNGGTWYLNNSRVYAIECVREENTSN